jgi:hypothetical protein
LGNQVPDFSYVGYYKGEKEIPKIPIVKTIEPVEGDNRRHIQKAIREIQNLEPNADGIRGGLLLKAGEYKVSDQLNVRKSGNSSLW